MTEIQRTVNSSSYLHPAAEHLKRSKERTYSWMHLQPGYSALDVGCGPGIDTIALAQHVGPIGRVVGVDHNPDMIAEATRKAEQAGCAPWCHHLQADATSLP